MRLLVLRDVLAPTDSLGRLAVDGVQFGYTLELPVRDGLPGSAIPDGTYDIHIVDSPHFGRPMPLIVGIPNRSEIEIHWGNDVKDTRGCILVGDSRDFSSMQIYNTRATFAKLFPLIEAAVASPDGCQITIETVQNNSEDVQAATAGEV
jgi:hypothetical protein